MQVNQEAWKNAGAEGLPAVAGLDRAIPDAVAEFLMKQQYVVAQQVMNKDQFDIFKEGWTKVQESPSIQAKQLAFKEVLLHWRPGTLYWAVSNMLDLRLIVRVLFVPLVVVSLYLCLLLNKALSLGTFGLSAALSLLATAVVLSNRQVLVLLASDPFCRHHVCILPSVSLPRHTAAINHTHIQHHCTQNQSKASLYKASHDHCF